MKKYIRLLTHFAIPVIFGIGSAGAQPVGTDFVYQGQLIESGQPTNGLYDFEFSLFDALEHGSQIGATLTVDDVSIEDGIFSTELDFGQQIFTGSILWLAIAVRDGTSTDGYTVLTPRQKVAATPYAIYSKEAATALLADNTTLFDGQPVSAFLLTSGGTITGDLAVSGTLDASIDPGSLPTVAEPIIYTPAFVTCGTNAESDPLQWSFIAGRFAIEVDGQAYEVEVGFSGVATMADVAQRIQIALRSMTGQTETVAWQTDHFRIASGDTTAASMISSAMSPAFGIDISGAGAEDWMDCDGGNALITEKSLNKIVYQGQIPVLNQFGELDRRWLPPSIGFDENTGGFVYQMDPADWHDGENTDLSRDGSTVTFVRNNTGLWRRAGRFLGPATWSSLDGEASFFAAVGYTQQGDVSFGLVKNGPNLEDLTDRVCFTWNWEDQKLYAVSSNGAVTATEISSINADSVKNLTGYVIRYSPEKAKFYVNGELVASHTSNIPGSSSAVPIGVAGIGSLSHPTNARLSMVSVRMNLFQ